MNIYKILEKTKVSEELKLRVETVVLECLTKAQKKYGENLITKIPEIRYDTKETVAGYACWNMGNPYIRINPILLNENIDEMLKQTVPHEVAHIIVDELNKDRIGSTYNYFTGRRKRTIAPHGIEWQNVMYCFGLQSDRCHDMNVESIRVLRNKKQYQYRCNCKTHIVGQIIHNRIVSGRNYTCKVCKTRVAFDTTL